MRFPYTFYAIRCKCNSNICRVVTNTLNGYALLLFAREDKSMPGYYRLAIPLVLNASWPIVRRYRKLVRARCIEEGPPPAPYDELITRIYSKYYIHGRIVLLLKNRVVTLEYAPFVDLMRTPVLVALLYCRGGCTDRDIAEKRILRYRHFRAMRKAGLIQCNGSQCRSNAESVEIAEKEFRKRLNRILKKTEQYITVMRILTETGTRRDVKKLGELCREKGVIELREPFANRVKRYIRYSELLGYSGVAEKLREYLELFNISPKGRISLRLAVTATRLLLERYLWCRECRSEKACAGFERLLASYYSDNLVHSLLEMYGREGIVRLAEDIGVYDEYRDFRCPEKIDVEDIEEEEVEPELG